MLDIRHFEQVLPERILKKGLRLFESGSVELLSRLPGQTQQFLVKPEATLSLKKRENQLISYACSCGKMPYCGHLAAVLFYFQQKTLGLSAVPEKKPRSSPRQTGRTSNDVESLIKELKATLAAHASDREIIYGLLQSKKQNAPDPFLLNLSASVVLPGILVSAEHQGDQLAGWIKGSFSELEERLLHLTKEEKKQWYKATLASVKTNAALKSESFLFLVPGFLSFVKDARQLLALKAALDSRKYRTAYTSRLDKLLIAQLEVLLKANRRFKMNFAMGQHASAAELIIAKCELDFYSGRADSAFKRLRLCHDRILKHQPLYYIDLLRYALEKAGHYGQPEQETEFLKKGLIHHVHIQPAYLERLTELLGEEALKETIDAIIQRVKKEQGIYAFDKTADLLYGTNRLDELLNEIRKQRNKFSLLHKVLLKKMPHYDQELLDLYLEHLLTALRESGFYQLQQHVFDKAVAYLGRLPGDVSRKLVGALLDRLGRTSQIGHYIAAWAPE